MAVAAPASGTNAGTVTVTATLGALTAGTYTTDVTVTAGVDPDDVRGHLTVAARTPPGLVAAYGFEETTGTSAVDSSANAQPRHDQRARRASRPAGSAAR